MMPMNPWQVETNELRIRRLGKLGEELSELLGVVCRALIQGIDEIDPASGKTNLQRFTEEFADVETQMILCKRHFDLDKDAVDERVIQKIAQMYEWEAVLKDKS